MDAKSQTYEYVGQELDLFALAKRWKAYVRSALAPYIQGHVLEVGAGIGTTTRVLRTCTSGPWTCLEPDPGLAARLTKSLKMTPLSPAPLVRTGTTSELGPEESFDTLLYIDVLEHIEHDAAEMQLAANLLKPGGCLVVLCPAHQFFFSPFDAAIGHYRRYNRPMMRKLTPPTLTLETCFYLDSVGMLLSLGNRLVLKSGSPTPTQIAVWDSKIVPVSRIVDRLILRSQGKTVVGIWRKPTALDPKP